MTDDQTMPNIGPVQLLVVGFQDGDFRGEILEQLRVLRQHDVIRLIDLLVVAKHDDDIAVVELSDLTPGERAEFGALAGALIGLGAGGEEGAEAGALAGAAAMVERDDVLDEDDLWYAADAIPDGATAAIALLEHRWAIPLRDAIVRAGGVTLADAWIHPADLIAIGAAAAA